MTGLSPPFAGAGGEDAPGLQKSSCSAPAHKQEHQVRQAVVRNQLQQSWMVMSLVTCMQTEATHAT